MLQAKTDIIVGLVTAVVGLLTLFVLVPRGVELYEVDESTLTLIRPDFWPMLVGGLMVFCGLTFSLISWRPGVPIDTNLLGDKPDADFQVDGRRLAVCIGIVLIFLFTGSETGLLLPGIVLFAICTFGFAGGSIWAKSIGAFAVPVLLALFFEKFANIPVPLGLLEGMF